MNADSLLPLCKNRDRSQAEFHNNPNCLTHKKYKDCKLILANGVINAKNNWAQHLAAQVTDIKNDPVKSWKSMRELENGLTGHHSKTRVIKMTKRDGTKAQTDKENAEVFSEHFSKIFNNTHITCDPTVLDLIEDREPKSDLGNAPTIEEVELAIIRLIIGDTQTLLD